MEDCIKKLNSAIAGVRPYLNKTEKKETLDKLEKRLAYVAKAETKILICGEFKRGKSSFINALIGRNLCAVDQDICTSVVSIIRYGVKERVMRNFGDFSAQQREEIPFADIEKYTVGRADEVKNTLFLEIELPLESLKNGMVLIDTPGVGGLDPRHAFITTYFLPLADITLFMTDVNEPLTVTELDFYKQKVARYAKHTFVIVNKCDLKTPEQVDDIKNDTVAKIAKHCEVKAEEVKAFAVSSKTKQNYNKTKVEKLYDKSGFRAVDEELAGTLQHIKEEQIRIIRDEFVATLDKTIEPLTIQLNQIEMPDPKAIVELKNKEQEIAAQAKELNDPASEFRMRVQKRITEYRENVINKLNEQSIIFSSNGLNSLMLTEEAKGPEGGKWIGKQLNMALESLGAEIIMELRTAFDKIATMEEFQGMLHFNVKDFNYEIKTIAHSKREVPLHKRLMSLMPGMGVGFATNLVAGSLLTAVGATFASVAAPILAVAAGVGMAFKNHSDTVNETELMGLREQYQPQITAAMQQLRTFVESRFSEFQQEWIMVITQRVKDYQVTLQELMKNLAEMSNNQKLALAKRMELERLIKPLTAQRNLAAMVLNNPFEKKEDNEKE